MLTAILTAAHCAACQNCCVFEEQSAWELPTFSAAAVARLHRIQPNIPVTPTTDGTRFVLTLPYDASHHAQPCPFLDASSGCTLPPEEKPFACSIWPVRVMNKDGVPALALYQGCPGIPSAQVPALRTLLQNGLGERILEEAKRDASLICAYHPNYRFL